jgi:thioredoxin 1
MGYKIIYNGAPLGMEASSFIETISLVSRKESNLSRESKEKLKNIDKDVMIRVFVTPTCPYCPQSVLLANQIAIESKGKVTAECVEANENMELSAKFNVMSVPQQVINDDIDSITIGIQPEEKFVEHILKYGMSNYKLENKSIKLENGPDKPINLTDANFEEAIKKYKNLVVDFWAPWCGACQMMSPVIEQLAKIYKGKITFAKLNTDENQKIAMEHGIMSIPTLIVFKDGKKMDQLVGAMSRKELEEKLKNIFG